MNESIEKKYESAKDAQRESAPEARSESYEQAVAGAEILEEPKNGSFVSAMQMFIAWVDDLLAGKK